MTWDVVIAQLYDEVLATWQMTTRRPLNHLPVLGQAGRPVGVLSADNVQSDVSLFNAAAAGLANN